MRRASIRATGALCGLRIERRNETRMRTAPSEFDQLFPATGGALYGPASHGWMASFRRSGSRTRMPGLYLAGGSTIRSGCSDGGRFRPLSDGRDPGGLRFDTPVSRGGYAWWYIDALSADGRYGLTVIAFVGSVFSPYYAFSRKHGSGDPLNHCALNIAFYSENRKCWAMTERGSGQLHRTSNSLTIGPSNVDWNGDLLTIDIREVTAPVPSRLRGVIRIYPKALSTEAFTIDGSGRHRWRPFAPCAHVEVSMSEPTLALARLGLCRLQQWR